MTDQYTCPICNKAVHDPDCPEFTVLGGIEKLIRENALLRQQLATLRESVLEEAAGIADAYKVDKFPESQWTATMIADRIRARKGRGSKS